MKLAIKLIVLSLFAASIAGCHTMNGAGKDVQAGGKALSNSAQKHGADDY